MRWPAFIWSVPGCYPEERTPECGRSSGEGTAHLRTPVTISPSFEEAAPVGEQGENVG